MKNFVSEFKAFVVKGNAVIGAAFNQVVESLVKDIILGAIATFAHQPDFASFSYHAIKWGSFINSLVNMLIVGFAVFMTIKFLNRITKKEVAKVNPTV
jgi:large conductance mechanosensitive channel